MALPGRRVLSLDQIRQEAAEFLQEYHGEGTIPVPIAEIAEFDFGLEIVPVLGIKEDLHVDAFLTSDLKSIYVDEFVLLHVPNRFRFSIAHELGHFWLHQDLYETCRIESVRDFRRIQTEIGSDDYKWFEWQANAFAGVVLVPAEALAREFQLVAARARENGLGPRDLEKHPARQRLIGSIAATFGVSEQTAAIRLEKDNLLPPLVADRNE